MFGLIIDVNWFWYCMYFRIVSNDVIKFNFKCVDDFEVFFWNVCYKFWVDRFLVEMEDV